MKNVINQSNFLISTAFAANLYQTISTVNIIFLFQQFTPTSVVYKNINNQVSFAVFNSSNRYFLKLSITLV